MRQCSHLWNKWREQMHILDHCFTTHCNYMFLHVPPELWAKRYKQHIKTSKNYTASLYVDGKYVWDQKYMIPLSTFVAYSFFMMMPHERLNVSNYMQISKTTIATRYEKSIWQSQGRSCASQGLLGWSFYDNESNDMIYTTSLYVEAWPDNSNVFMKTFEITRRGYLHNMLWHWQTRSFYLTGSLYMKFVLRCFIDVTLTLFIGNIFVRVKIAQ